MKKFFAALLVLVLVLCSCQSDLPAGGIDSFDDYNRALTDEEIAAAMKGAMICGNLTALLSSTPDQAALRQELGYRAENVSGLMGPV